MVKYQKCVPFLNFEVQCLGCVKNPKDFVQKLEAWIREELNPDLHDDIILDIITLIIHPTTRKPVDFADVLNKELWPEKYEKV